MPGAYQIYLKYVVSFMFLVYTLYASDPIFLGPVTCEECGQLGGVNHQLYWVAEVDYSSMAGGCISFSVKARTWMIGEDLSPVFIQKVHMAC